MTSCNGTPPACQEEIAAASRLVTIASEYAAQLRAGEVPSVVKASVYSEMIAEVYRMAFASGQTNIKPPGVEG